MIILKKYSRIIMSFRLILKFTLILMFIFFINITKLFGQVDTEFWFAIPKETNNHGSITNVNNVSFKITNQSNVLTAHVEISMPANPAFITKVIDIPPSQSFIQVMATSFPEFATIYANPSAYNVTAVSGNTNRGIYIKSNNDITVYYDYDNYYNRDLFSLKGRNSLGIDFYLPFQNIWNNDSVPTRYGPDNPLSSANIVATEDGTIITVYPTALVQGRVNLLPYTITLNKGETYSMVAASRLASGRLSGTRVTSNHPIAITINDDSVPVATYGCYDILGDQIIPTSVIGTKYLVMTGNASTAASPAGVQQPQRGEQIFVTGTQPGTQVYFRRIDGTLLYTTTINAQGTTYVTPDINDPNQTSIYIFATKPVYVMHITGIGCEMGAAVLPPITNCTGSNEVSFYRSSISSGGSSSMTLNLMIPYDKNIPLNSPTQSHNYFTVHYQDGSSAPIPASWFEPVDSAGWVVLHSNFRGNAGIGTLIPINQAVKITNDKDFFHLGITNGYSSQTNKYGYFSSFNATMATAVVASVNETAHISCFGDTVFLRAAGGLEYTWHYGTPSGPPTYLSNQKSSTPQVFCPPGVHDYYVVVRQSKCFGDDTLKITVRVLPEVKAYFETDVTAACAPFRINITNKTIGATKYEWSYRKDNDPPIVFTPPTNTGFIQPSSGDFQNNTSPYKPVVYSYKLRASYFGECPDTVTKQIVVYPVINANFYPQDTTSCNPAVIYFRNMSNGNVADSLYHWNFGDGSTSPVKNPLHIFENLFRATDSTYSVSLVATSPYYCRDTARATVRVFPFVKANFTVDTVRGCSPLTIRITNNSLNKNAISQYLWDFGDGTTRIAANDTLIHTYPVNTSATSVNYKLTLSVRHRYDNGCPDTVSRAITVYPQTAISFLTNPGGNSICDSTVVSFNTTSSAAINSFLWDFGDGNSSTAKNPNHLFTNNSANDKTYRVKLTGISNEYCNGYAYKDITVHAFLDPQFALNAASFCAPFNANIINKSRGGITRYEWRYGDGSSDNHSVTDTIHRFRNTTNVVFSPLVKLVVTNSGGCKDSVSQRINVYPEIRADFSTPALVGCNPFPVSFTNRSNYMNQVSKYYKWDFGDNTSSTVQHPEHTFTNFTSATVSYPVKLTVTSDYNCTSDTVKNISVYPFVEAKFSVDSVKGCSPYPIRIHNASKGGITQYEWNYGDGTVDNHASALYTHTYINNFANNPASQPLQRYLKLVASNTNGLCTSRDSMLITIYPEVDSRFTADVTEGCNPLTVRYTNQSGPGTIPVEYNWLFGDGATAVTRNTSHTFENLTSSEQTFKTKLIAYSIYKCSDTTNLDIKVYPFIEADFSFDKSVGCSPHTINITNSSSAGSNSFHWIFDDGSTSSVSAPAFNHVYRNLGTSPRIFYPKLVTSYNGFCQDTVVQSLQVYPEVTALFTQDTLRGCHPLEVTLTNQSRNANRYNWTFGDRGTSVLTHPKHLYMNFSNVDSVYNLSLTATSIYNCKSTLNKQVVVYAKPKALLNVAKSVSCPPFNLSIQNLSEAGDFYTWSFGDGDSIVSTNLLPVSHVYDNLTATTATYDLKLFVQSVYNCSDEITQSINVFPRVLADFTPDTSGCSPLLVPMKNNTLRAITYKWDFGDKITSALKNPSHKFFNNSIEDTTFNVQMIGFSEYGCSDTAFRQVIIHPQPLVEFSALPSHLFYPDARVNLDNQTNAGNWNYQWNFDDGQTSSALEPGSHEYMQWGNYNIWLKAWSDYCSDSVSHRIRVYAPKTIADFDASPNGCVPLTVQFTNHSTWATSYKWEFDDGSISTEVHPNHIFQKPGKYQVKLTTFGDGASDVTYREVEVYPKPIVEFDVSPRYVMLPDARVHFYNTSKLGHRYQWHFGDGDTSAVFEPVHTYKELGTYDVTLNIWTEHQCFESKKMTEAVKVEGKGTITFPNAFRPSIEGPNGGAYTYPDTKNTVFHPYHDGVAEYKLEIYNRWGELLFESNDVNIGWDGYYKKELCKSDVYIWKAKGKFYNGTTFNKAGDVTLLR